MVRRIGIALLFVLVLAAGGILEVTRQLRQPFTLDGYLKYVQERGFYVKPSPKISSFAANKLHGVLINYIAPLNARDMRTRAYFIDTLRLVKDWRTPQNFRDFTMKYLYTGGYSFACQRVSLLNGSFLEYGIDGFFEKAMGSNRKSKRKTSNEDNISDEDMFMAVFAHEWAHLMLLHFHPTEEGSHSIEKNMKEGYAALEHENNESASKSFEKVLQVCPAYYEAMDELAVAKIRLGKFKEAVELLRRSLLVSSDDNPIERQLVARQAIVRAMIDSGDLAAARKQIDENREFDPKNPENDYWLAIVLFKKGDAVGAYSVLAEAREKYLADKNEHVVGVDLLIFALAAKSGFGAATSQQIFRDHFRDCRVVQPKSEYAKQVCGIRDALVFGVFATSALDQVGGTI